MGSHVKRVTGLQAFTISCSGKISWKDITLTSLDTHPALLKGSRNLVKITTESGKTLTASKAKSFLVVRDGKIRIMSGTSLELDDKVPVLRLQPQYGSGFYGYGSMLGAFYSVGKIVDNTIIMPLRMKEFFRFDLQRFQSAWEVENDTIKYTRLRCCTCSEVWETFLQYCTTWKSALG